MVGGRLAGRTGAVVGGLAGATVPSATMNIWWSSVQSSLEGDEKVDPKEAAQWAAVATVPITALDMASLGTIVGKVGLGTVKSEINKAVAKRIAIGIAEGASTEGITEGVQEVIKDATVSLKAGKPFWTAETGMGVVESAVGGALTGGAMGGPMHALPQGSHVPGIPQPETAVVTPETIESQVRAGNVPGVVAPTNDPTVPPPPGPTPPPPIPGQDTITNVGGQTMIVPTDPEAAPGTVPPTPVDTGEHGVETTVAVTPGQGLDSNVANAMASAEGVLSEPSTPPVAATVEGAPETVAKEAPTLPGEMVPVEGAYSRLRAWVEERGPVRATAQRWASILRRGDFTAEEAKDMRVSQFLAGAGREQLTREALLNHLDQERDHAARGWFCRPMRVRIYATV